ncbi:MAG: hypothetical protein JWR67_2906 [Mucilaginibacter sp.]|nr:hypothetical protein [Mucilaginibacter sp.]
MKSKRLLLIIPILTVLMVECDNSRKRATVGGSIDTANSIRAGSPPVADTSTISAREKKSADSLKSVKKDKDTTKKPTGPAKGNADPSGSLNKSNSKKP